MWAKYTLPLTLKCAHKGRVRAAELNTSMTLNFCKAVSLKEKMWRMSSGVSGISFESFFFFSSKRKNKKSWVLFAVYGKLQKQRRTRVKGQRSSECLFLKLLSNPDIIFWKFFQLNNSKGVGIGKEVAAAIHFIFYPFYRKISCLSHRRSVLKGVVFSVLPVVRDLWVWSQSL